MRCLFEVGADHPVVFFEVSEDADDEVLGDWVDVGKVLLCFAEGEDRAFEHRVGVVEGVGVFDEGVFGGGDGGVSEGDALSYGGVSQGDDAFGEFV